MFEIDFTFNEPFTLESGEVLSEVKLRGTVYGKLNSDRSNAILVFHALTGSSRIGDWWNGLMCDGCALDTSEFAFICVNYLGSCYGSTSARSLKKRRTKGSDAPLVTLRDIVQTNVHLLEYLGIKKFRAVVVGSVGGMLALQFAADYPELTERCISIAATPLSARSPRGSHAKRVTFRRYRSKKRRARRPSRSRNTLRQRHSAEIVVTAAARPTPGTASRSKYQPARPWPSPARCPDPSDQKDPSPS